MRKTIALLTLLALTVPLAAHPGHGTGSPWSPDHYMGNPAHAIPISLLIVLVGILFIRWIEKRQSHKS